MMNAHFTPYTHIPVLPVNTNMHNLINMFPLNIHQVEKQELSSLFKEYIVNIYEHITQNHICRSDLDCRCSEYKLCILLTICLEVEYLNKILYLSLCFCSPPYNFFRPMQFTACLIAELHNQGQWTIIQ